MERRYLDAVPIERHCNVGVRPGSAHCDREDPHVHRSADRSNVKRCPGQRSLVQAHSVLLRGAVGAKQTGERA